jgi:MerR family transcriptional regulator/heat shock protein HspR
MSRDEFRVDEDAPVYAISVAATLSGLHPQTLRQYDRLGLVSPSRVQGRNRLYSQADVVRLREIAQLSAEGLSLEGIRRVLALQAQVDQLRGQLDELHRERGSNAIVLWRPKRAG